MNKLLLAALLLIPQLAFAQEAPKCGLLANASKNLAKEYGEHMAFMFSAGADEPTAMTIFLNPKTGTMTMFAIRPDRKGRILACEFLEGEPWRALKEPPPEEDEGDPS